MKQMKYFFAALTIVALAAASCGNSGETSTTTPTDTVTQPVDTIKSDPSTFSDPH
ncbi:hypothetical protein SAMN05444008_102220 [Cnuella takakiae]|uniref:Uncharacterized protein n=1 Tax=Cnuella takakiae TaxID=1302690 RepID=A0A1M4VCQ0_9BACT|nr:hypothetical protein [Cnuella takakiae]SHE66726.1 hypothetical protein SAMN05444008_102220 [Cnuella takakiae]